MSSAPRPSLAAAVGSAAVAPGCYARGAMRRWIALATFLVSTTGCTPGCEAEPQAEAQVQWFEAAPLLRNLRDADREGAARSVAPRALDQITLHDLAVRVADDLASFSATEELYFTNTTGEALPTVVLRIYGNAVGDAPRVRVVRSACVGTRCSVAAEGSVVEVRPTSPLGAGDRLRIRLELAGELQAIDPSRSSLLGQAMEGLGRMGSAGSHGDYGLLAHGSGIASLGNFYATVAPRREGAWVRGDDSTMGDLGADGIVHFRAKVRAPQGSVVAVTGDGRERTVLGRGGQPGYTEVEAVAGLTRNFAIALSRDFEVASAEVHGVQVRSFFLPAHRAAGMAALETAKHAMHTFHRRFGPYPYRGLEVVEAPLVGGAGGVEFSGLVTVAQMFYGGGGGGAMGMLSGLLGGGAGGGMQDMQSAMLDFVVAHEVAHQWWHGLVGSDARAHPFVDESLAQFSAMLYVEERFGAERARREGQRQVASNYHFMRLQGGADGAVDRPVGSFPSEMAYAGLVYGKGPFLYPAIREAVGDRAFFERLRAYVSEHRFGEAPARALMDRFAQGPHRARVRRLERHWLEQSHGDEDLGEADFASLAGLWMGDGAGGSALESLAPLLGGGANGGPSALDALAPLLGGGGSGAADGDSDAALRRVIQALEGMR